MVCKDIWIYINAKFMVKNCIRSDIAFSSSAFFLHKNGNVWAGGIWIVYIGVWMMPDGSWMVS